MLVAAPNGYIKQGFIKEQLARVVSIDGSGELTERMENLWKGQKFYQCLTYLWHLQEERHKLPQTEGYRETQNDVS